MFADKFQTFREYECLKTSTTIESVVFDEFQASFGLNAFQTCAVIESPLTDGAKCRREFDACELAILESIFADGGNFPVGKATRNVVGYGDVACNFLGSAVNDSFTLFKESEKAFRGYFFVSDRTTGECIGSESHDKKAEGDECGFCVDVIHRFYCVFDSANLYQVSQISKAIVLKTIVGKRKESEKRPTSLIISSLCINFAP